MSGLQLRVAAALATVAALALIWAGLGTRLFLGLTASGISLGAIYALSGLGLVITFRATGVFNFAHGAVAMLVTYVLWQLGAGWGLPTWLAAPIALFVVGPGIGVVLARFVFRPLDERDAGQGERLVATIGLFILFVGIAVAIWGAQTKTDPVAIFSNRAIRFGAGVTMSVAQLAIVVLVGLVSVGIYWLFERTGFGLRMRAVVEARELAELTAVDANTVSAVAWAIGTGLAGLTGALLAPSTFGLDPYHLTLLVAETFAVAVLARLESLTLTVLGGLGLGLASSYATQLRIGDLVAAVGIEGSSAEALTGILQPALSSLPVIALFAAVLIHRQFPGGSKASGLARVTARARPAPPIARWALDGAVAGAVLVSPWVVDVGTLRRLHDLLALAIVFVSIVIVTGLGGHITLGQAAFAGFGAFVTGRLVAGSVPWLPALPVIPATVLAGLVCIPLGAAVGWPALRRRGLLLGLTTFAVGLMLERFLFANYALTAGPGVLDIRRPSLFGFSLAGDAAFLYYEAAVFGLSALLAVWLRRGRIGRTVRALRDSETGARSVGVRVRRYTLLVFVIGTALAGVGGSLLAQSAETFSSSNFGTFDSLIWFMTVLVAGVADVHGALLAAFALTLLESWLGETGVVILLVGLGAMALGRLPGGVVGAAKRAILGEERPPVRRRRRRLEPSPLARQLLDRASSGAGT